MSPEHGILTPEERDELELTALVRHRLEEQFHDLEQQHEAAALGMWVFLATEVMFFGALFVGLGAYRFQYPVEFEKASEQLNWMIGGINTVVLLVSSLFMVLAVHYAKLGRQKRVVVFLLLTAALGIGFLCLKGLEYYLDYVDNLIPGWRFDDNEWVRDGLRPDQVPHVKLFLMFYWIMTALHGLHVTIGIAAVLVMAVLAQRGHFSPAYYSPVDVTALYWHFVDTVWIFLLPMLYLLGTHTLQDLPFREAAMAERTISTFTYSAVCVVLVLLTVLTVSVSFIELPGLWHIVIGLTIALCKATLVVLFFMHVLISNRLVWIVVLVSCFWLGILLTLTLNDYFSRGMVPFAPGH